jgi:hypothetical protein
MDMLLEQPAIIKEARQEVVDWVNEHTYGGLGHTHIDEWESQLKKWGIYEKET